MKSARFFSLANFLRFFYSFPLFLLFQFLDSIVISEVNYLTYQSKYYNQAIEIVNTYSTNIRLTDYYLISKNGIEERTNEIRLWSGSEQTKLSNLNFNVSDWLEPYEVGVILDPGYVTSYLASNSEGYQLSGVKVFTVSTGVLGKTSFIKEDDILSIQASSWTLADRFPLISATKGFSVNRISLTNEALSNNLALLSPTIGSNTSISDNYTTQVATRLTWMSSPMVVGIPQSSLVQCTHQGLVSFSCNRSLYLKEHPYLKIYYRGASGNLNVLNDSDELVFIGGQSFPIVGISIQPGSHSILIDEDVFNPIEVTVSDFSHSQKEDVFISEIYYNTNKNITWMEIYFKKPFTGELSVVTYNSEYQQRQTYDLPLQHYSVGWKVFGFQNSDFSSYPWSDQIIDLGNTFQITAKGVIVIQNDDGILDAVHYNKDWVDSYDYSLQRDSYDDYAFGRNSWNSDNEKRMTPLEENFKFRNYDFSFTLVDSKIHPNAEQLSVMMDIPEEGFIIATLFYFDGTEIGMIWDIQVEREWNRLDGICLKKANLKNGSYYLKVQFVGESQSVFLTKNFHVEG